MEVVDRYTVKFLLKEPNVWLVDVLANAEPQDDLQAQPGLPPARAPLSM
jgi:hypothetical protein